MNTGTQKRPEFLLSWEGSPKVRAGCVLKMPYGMKAGDPATGGDCRPSAFLLAPPDGTTIVANYMGNIRLPVRYSSQRARPVSSRDGLFFSRISGLSLGMTAPDHSPSAGFHSRTGYGIRPGSPISI